MGTSKSQFPASAVLFAHGREDKLLFGENPADGRMVTIDEITLNGLACGLVCPNTACGRSLVACLQVTKKRPYLRHQRAPCKFAGESALHKYAKQLIQRHGSIRLPEVVLDGRTLRPERRPAFDSVVLEHRFHKIIPDIIANIGNHQLLIEIRVTHACDERKTAVMANQVLNTVEIDLSKLNRAAPLAELDRAILESASREWLFNHRIPAERERLRLEQERHDIGVASVLTEQLRSRQGHVATKTGPLSEDEQYLRLREMSCFVGIDLPGAWATAMAPQIWQAAVLRDVMAERGVDGAEIVTPADLKAILQELPGRPLGIVDLKSSVAERVRAELPDFATLDDLARSYHDALIERGFLEPGGRINHAVITRANAAYRRYREAEERRAAERKYQEAERENQRQQRELDEQRRQRRATNRAKVEAVIVWLLSSVPVEDQVGFSLRQWWQTPLLSGQTPESFLDYGEAWFLTNKLETLKQLLVPGALPIDNLLNLPLQSVRAQRVAEADAESLAQQQAVIARRLQFVEAWSRRRDKEPDWIDVPQLSLGGLSPRQTAQGPEKLWQQLHARERHKDEMAVGSSIGGSGQLDGFL